MKTPICDFVRDYCRKDPLRMHMPGHKGIALLGMEAMDLTEIPGADSLYEADGIIAESERNATALFGTGGSFYSAEGSSHCIRAMLYLLGLAAREQGRPFRILAGRNAHKTFVTAAGLLDAEVSWLRASGSYLSCTVEDLQALEARLQQEHFTALYLTSPDYLGNCCDIGAVARVCHRNGVLLAVDDAHGAYLHFLPEKRHPMDLGADLCCDSAHKTLPALTGAAYLHLSAELPAWFFREAKDALAVFGTTSPSYLILQSLDAVNRYLADGFREKLRDFLPVVEREKAHLERKGWTFTGDEPMKWTLMPKSRGYTGTRLAEELALRGVVCEFADPDFLVMMLSAEAGEPALRRLVQALDSIPVLAPVTQPMPGPHIPAVRMSVRQAMLSPRETVPVEKAEGRVLAALNVACPPAVPIAVCGEEIDREAVERFRYYGISTCKVVR